jgi:hypothetical protein
MKTSVGLTNETIGKISEEVSRLYKTKSKVRRKMTTNSQIAELALAHFFSLSEQDRDAALSLCYTEVVSDEQAA